LASNAWARRCARAVTVGAWLGLASISVSAPDAAAAEEKPESADACVSFHDEVGEKQLVVHATNDCKLRLSCRLDYTVRCTDLDGKQTSRLDRRAPFALPPQGKATVALSAESCRQGWAIDDFSWTCR
jgi:hypothetical protein